MAAVSSRSGSERTLLATVMIVYATALASCSASQPSDVNPTSGSTLYESSTPIVRAPLSDPLGYVSSTETPSLPYASSDAADPQAVSLGSWQASPRWAAVKGDGCIEVDQEADKPAGAAKFRVTKCSKDDLAPR